MGGYILICLDLDEIRLQLLGIEYPGYENLFPHPVKAYEQQFGCTEK